jgi:hypothetical protein
LGGKGHWIRMATLYHYQSKHWHAKTIDNLWVKKLYNCEGDVISPYYGFHPFQVTKMYLLPCSILGSGLNMSNATFKNNSHTSMLCNSSSLHPHKHCTLH